MNLPIIPQDKADHYLYGNLIFVAVFVAAVLFLPTSLALPLSMLVVCIAGVGKEIYDGKSGTGTPEVMDAVYTIAGGLSGAVVAGILLY